MSEMMTDAGRAAQMEVLLVCMIDLVERIGVPLSDKDQFMMNGTRAQIKEWHLYNGVLERFDESRKPDPAYEAVGPDGWKEKLQYFLEELSLMQTAVDVQKHGENISLEAPLKRLTAAVTQMLEQA